MKSFITKVTLLLLTLLLINSYKPIKGLYNLYKYYQYPSKASVKLINPNHSIDKNTLVIGCSNLQHNIDQAEVQKNLSYDVDFLFFSAAEGSTFLQFVVDEGLTKGYKQIVLYVPYQMLKKSNFQIVSPIVYRQYGCYKYSLSTIRHCPTDFFYDWADYFDSIKAYRAVADEKTNYYIADHDAYMDTLGVNNNSYTNCNEKFVESKHYIGIPQFDTKDVKFIWALKSKDQKMAIILCPIPDMQSDRKSVANSNIMKAGFPNILNVPHVLDSTLFYDQWYHLNKCGKTYETNNLINYLKKLAPGT